MTRLQLSTILRSRIARREHRGAREGAANPMLQFTVCVELRDAKPEHHRILHEEMGKRGFTNTLTSTDGRIVVMPRGGYNFEGDVTRDEVLTRTKAAVKVTTKTAGIVITQVAKRTWSGLNDSCSPVEDLDPAKVHSPA